jgi:hypothetical protein
MRFMRLPLLMVLIALASSALPQFDFLLRFGGMALATLTVLGALSDMNGATRRAESLGREDVLKLWFGGKLRERHTWEALTAEVTALASALRLPAPTRPALPAPDPSTNGHRAAKKKRTAAQADAEAPAETAQTPRPSLWPTLRVLGIEAVSELMVLAAILLNWFRPPTPAPTSGEQVALLALGLLALGLVWFDWRLMRRFVAAVHREVARLSPQASTSATSSS